MGSATVQPMIARRWKPCDELRPFVDAYGVREAGLGTEQVYVPLHARRDFFLEFYLRGRYRIVTVANGAEHWAPHCVLVGPSTQRREDLKLSGSLEVFSIRFFAHRLSCAVWGSGTTAARPGCGSRGGAGFRDYRAT